MKKWFIPLLACWLYGCNSGPGEEAIQSQVTARLQAETDANLFEISDFAVLDKEERMEGVYLVRVSYRLHFKQGLDQLQVLHDEDLVYDRVGPFQQEMALMELERKNGDVRLKRTEEIWVEAYDALAKSKEDCMTAQTQLEVAAKLAGVTLSGGRLPSGETDETLTAAQKAVDAAQAAQDEAQKKFNSANRLGISENVINYITQSRQLNEKLATTQEKITALDVMAQQARQVTAPHDGYIVEINVKAGDSYDGKTAALVISSESGDAVLRADTSKIEKKIDKGTQVTVKRDSDKTLTKKVTDSGVNEEGKRYIDVKLTDKDITNLGGGAALFSAAVEMTASYRASSSTTLLPASAVRGSGDSRYVYIVSEESNALGQRVLKVKKQDVKVLSEVGSTVSIQDDLSRQRVAYMEDRAISDGSEVMVYGE